MIETMNVLLSIAATCGIIVFVAFVLSRAFKLPEWLHGIVGLSIMIGLASGFIGGLIWIWT